MHEVWCACYTFNALQKAPASQKRKIELIILGKAFFFSIFLAADMLRDTY